MDLVWWLMRWVARGIALVIAAAAVVWWWVDRA